jgi:hypothetical protein
MSNYRNPKLLKLAKDAPCMNCHIMDNTIVAAHSNQLRDGKGVGIKSHDYRISYLCSLCHASIDNNKELSREERIELWEDAHRRTIGYLFTSGHLEVK